MRYLCACLAALACTPLAHAGGKALAEARERLLRGNYGEAREQYADLAKKAEHRVAAALGISRAWQAEGQYDKALAALDKALADSPKNADLHAARAELLYTRGRWDDAQDAARKALKLARDQHFLAHWALAQVLRDRGELLKFNTELTWFVRAYNKRLDEGGDFTDLDDLLLVGLASCERARQDRRLNDQFQDVLSDIWGEAAKKDKSYWPAHYQIGRLYLEKYNYGSAEKSFTAALAINPRSAETLTAKAALALQRYEVKDAEDYADRALRINPSLTEALRVKADILLLGGDIPGALKRLEAARAVNPRQESTLARVAACLHLQKKGDAFKAVVEEVEKYNRKPGLFFADLGERLEERKLYKEAEAHYKTAIRLRPTLAAPRNHLGLLYMRLGDEAKAQEILEEAAKRDPYNVRVYNSLKVLDHLEKYARLETRHFILRYDPKNDKTLAAFMAKYLEDIHAEYKDLFQYAPRDKILIEVFRTHTMFSGRVVALPDLRTVGACTGRLVAMVSPKDQAGIIDKPFNWLRVLRHELVHVFNLEQTRFGVPHWFTEGLAVSLEGFPMPPMWYDILKRRVGSGELMNLDNIQMGFARVGAGEQWQLAYLQSHLYVEFLKSTYGKKVIGGFLKAYADGLSTEAALKKVCGVGKEQFEKDYRKHLEKLVENFAGRPAEKVLSFSALREAQAKDPDNPDLAAKLAERYLLTGNDKLAAKLADAALAKKANHPLASVVKAQLLLGEKEALRALGVLESAVDPKAPEPQVLRLLGRLQFEGKKFAEAARTYELGRKAQPYESVWLVELARVYNQLKDEGRLIGVLKDLAPTNADDLATRRKLAELLAKAGRHAEAERYAREALEIDVTDGPSRRLLADALQAQNKNDELQRLKKLLGE
jgi:tetratricopeptide (TPR) repeat protein